MELQFGDRGGKKRSEFRREKSLHINSANRKKILVSEMKQNKAKIGDWLKCPLEPSVRPAGLSEKRSQVIAAQWLVEVPSRQPDQSDLVAFRQRRPWTHVTIIIFFNFPL